MSDEDRDQREDHWKALAEQLGLAPEPDRPAPPAPRVRAEADEDRSASRPPAVRRGDQPIYEDAGETPAVQHERVRPEPVRGPEPAEPWEPDEAGPGTEVGPTGEAGRAPDERTGRRRRRRRGGKERGARRETGEAEPLEEAAGTHEATLEKEPDERPAGRHRRRGRGRDRPPPDQTDQEVAEPAPEEDMPAEEGEATAVAETDEPDEELPSPGEWNVPSWQDLIDSLYRPDR
jgi:hypothetical protein